MPLIALADKNVIRSEKMLEGFLGKDPSNRIALTDFCCMESYKGIAERNLPRSIRALERFASQVLILRSGREIGKLSAVFPLDVNTFVDPSQTEGFAEFCGHVREALSGNARYRRQLDEHAREANAYLARLQSEAAGLAPGILAIAKELPRDTLQRLRRGEEPTIEDIEVFIPGMLLLAREFFIQHPDFDTFPDPTVLPQTFVLRFAVASYLLAIDWIRRGGVEGASPQKLGNDVVDMNYVATSMYFDDLLTRDEKMISLYAEARWYVCNIFGKQG